MPKAIKKRTAKKKKPETVEIKNTAMEALDTIKEKKRLLIYIAAALGIIIILIASSVVSLPLVLPYFSFILSDIFFGK